MINIHSYKKVTWIDMENPTQEEVRGIMKQYNIHPLAAEDLLLPNTRSKVDHYEEYSYLVLHFPAWKHSHKDNTQEIDFIIGKKFILTARYDTIDPLHKFSKMLEVNSVLEKNELIGENAGYMFYYMMREIYHSLHDELDSIGDSLSDVQKLIFTGKEKEMVYEISNISRQLLSFRQATSLHEEALESFKPIANTVYGNEYGHYMESILGEYKKVEKTTQGLLESLGELRQTNAALLETKQNKIMMTFTAITIISSMVSIIFSWFLVQSADTPFNESPHEFAYVGIVAISVALFLAIVMRIKKWL